MLRLLAVGDSIGQLGFKLLFLLCTQIHALPLSSGVTPCCARMASISASGASIALSSLVIVASVWSGQASIVAWAVSYSVLAVLCCSLSSLRRCSMMPLASSTSARASGTTALSSSTLLLSVSMSVLAASFSVTAVWASVFIVSIACCFVAVELWPCSVASAATVIPSWSAVCISLPPLAQLPK